ncbi:MAG: RpiB/LacA/LacB family sugar-phosphate isomerase [Candidatus Symbiothrix sp.]|jgi:ribose 5-phosphate isomerase B|nr:RpiB/LacA/LacB family sugar-phosphate isomerase [Candidatus Symbiothrix sp.]
MNKIFPQSGKPIGICSDHAGFELKSYIISLMEKENIEYQDFGTNSSESSDYPDFAHKLGNAIDNDDCEIGIAMCGTGNGINMTLNKHQSVRSALCWNEEIAHYAKAHNNANIITIPARIVTKEEAVLILQNFFSTKFEGGKHMERIRKIPLK